MKIARLLNTQIKNGSINNCFLVPDNYDFTINKSEDVTSIGGLEIFVDLGTIEYGVFRDILNNIYVPNWSSLTHTEKTVCVKHYKYPNNISQTEFNSYFTQEQHESNWDILIDRSRDYRQKRLFGTFSSLSYYCNSLQVATIYMTTKIICIDYYYANLPHLILWLSNGRYPALGVDYTNNGFSSVSGYTPQLRDKLLDILINGNYPIIKK